MAGIFNPLSSLNNQQQDPTGMGDITDFGSSSTPYDNMNVDFMKSAAPAKAGMTSAETQMAGAGIGVAANVVGGLVSQGFQSNENKKARAEARQIAEMNRQDTLKQEQFVNSLNKKAYDRDKKNLALKKLQDTYNLRYNRFMLKLKQSSEAKNKMNEVSNNMFNAMKSTNLQDIFMNMQRGV